MSKPLVTHDSTNVFSLQGGQIINAIHGRLLKYEQEKAECLTKIAEEIRKAAAMGETPDDPSRVAASLVVVLMFGKHLTVGATLLHSLATRAVFLTEETYELSCIARNLQTGDFYKVTVNEARRYGLV